MFFVLSMYVIGLQKPKIEYPSVFMKVELWKGVMNFYLWRFLWFIPLYLPVILAVYLLNYMWLTFIMLLAGIAGRLVAGCYSGMDGYAKLLLISAIACFAAGLLISRMDLLPEKWQNPASRSWRMLLSAAVLLCALFVFAESFYTETVFCRIAMNIMCAWLILVCIRNNVEIPRYFPTGSAPMLGRGAIPFTCCMESPGRFYPADQQGRSYVFAVARRMAIFRNEDGRCPADL